ncbi:MAG: hypothetical protein AB2L11_07525 [Syntrophobacteraceae bacterium]
MSIRMLASELYRTLKEVEELENKLKSLGSKASERTEYEDRLRLLKAERDRVRCLVEGAKES